MNKITEKEWLEDFQDFVRSEGMAAPESASKAILTKVHADLNPSPWSVFAKLFGIHAVVGTLSLAICNQFGISPFQTGFSLSDYFIKFGDSACMFLCGVLFMGLSMGMGLFLLRPEDLKVLRKNAFLEVFGLSSISLGVFMAFGAEIALTVGILWLMGGMIAGVGVAKLPRKLRPSL